MSEVPPRPQKAVIDGKPTYTSASSLQTADPASGGCGRKWWFQKVMGLKSPPTKSQAVGTKTHAEIEHYLKTGELTLGPIALAGKHLIPEPHDSYLIEHRIWHQQLKPAGIPVEGYIDLVRPPIRPPMGGPEVEVIDWKTTSNLRWAKSGLDLPKTIQMGLYAKWALDYYKVDSVRLSHVYFQTKGMPQAMKSTIVVNAEQITRKWESIEQVAGSLYQLAAAEDVAQVTPNRDACDSFGGCPFYSQCPRSTAEIFDMTTDNPTVPDGFVDAWGIITRSGRGLPPVHGEVAKIVAYITAGSDRSVEQLPGMGELGGLPSLHDPSTILELAKELEATAPEEVAPPEVLPPDAPESDPAKAALPVPKDVPAGVLSFAEAKKLNKGPLIEAYETCFAALMERVDDGLSFNKGQEDRPAPAPVPTPANDNEPTIYINCVPPEPCDRLETYISNTVQALAASAKEPDIRMSKKDALAFGKWRGVLAAAVLESPPTGNFTVVCKGDEFADVVVQALEGTHRIVRGF